MKLGSYIGLVMLFGASLFAGNYKVDVSHSQVGFKVRHMMVSNVTGLFKNFDGTFTYDEKTKKLTNLKGTVQVDSIDTAEPKRDAHLKGSDFFDVARFATMQLQAKSFKTKSMMADLTIRGVTKTVKFDIVNPNHAVDSWKNLRAGFTLEATIKRSDFGLTYNSVLEAGGVAIADEVKIILEIEGIAQK